MKKAFFIDKIDYREAKDEQNLRSAVPLESAVTHGSYNQSNESEGKTDNG